MWQRAVLIWIGLFVLAGTGAAQPVGPIEGEPAAGGAWADGVGEANQAAARERFERGNQALREALFVRARDQYREALGYWDHPAIHYNLALALVNLDDPVALFAALEKARSHGAAAIGDERFERAGDYLKLVSGLIAPVEITLAAKGATLTVDGREVLVGPGTWKTVLRAGCYDMRAYKEGYMPAERRICVVGGEPLATTFEIYTDTGPSDLPYRKPLPRVASYALVGAGFMAAFGGGVLASADDDEVRRAGYVGLGAGAAFVVVGVTLVIYERTRWRPVDGLAVAPTYDGSTVGFAAAARF